MHGDRSGRCANIELQCRQSCGGRELHRGGNGTDKRRCLHADEQHGNGTATNAASVNNPGDITCQTPVLAIAKTPDAGIITAGETATFTIVLTNNGPGTATGLRSATRCRPVVE